jgi:hypothetical protein
MNEKQERRKKGFAHPPPLGVDASPFLFLFSLLFSVLCLLCRCTFSRIFLLVGLLFSFLILSHDFHEALFLNTRTYLSRVQYIQNVLEYGLEKTNQSKLLGTFTHLYIFPDLPFSSHPKHVVVYPWSIASLSAFLALTLAIVVLM